MNFDTDKKNFKLLFPRDFTYKGESIFSIEKLIDLSTDNYYMRRKNYYLILTIFISFLISFILSSFKKNILSLPFSILFGASLIVYSFSSLWHFLVKYFSTFRISNTSFFKLINSDYISIGDHLEDNLIFEDLELKSVLLKFNFIKYFFRIEKIENVDINLTVIASKSDSLEEDKDIVLYFNCKIPYSDYKDSKFVNDKIIII